MSVRDRYTMDFIATAEQFVEDIVANAEYDGETPNFSDTVDTVWEWMLDDLGKDYRHAFCTPAFYASAKYFGLSYEDIDADKLEEYNCFIHEENLKELLGANQADIDVATLKEELYETLGAAQVMVAEDNGPDSPLTEAIAYLWSDDILDQAIQNYIESKVTV